LARTPLLGFLEQLAADHAAAEERGVSVGELRDRRLTRRTVLKGVAAAGVAGALATAGVPARRTRAAGQPSIAIIGGGICGLTAALSLADKGISSTIYEASDRVGGRMHSDTRGYWQDSQISEWCGELIDTGHKTVLSLAQRYKLATTDLLGAQPNAAEDTYKLFGAYYTKEQADIDFKPVHNALQGDVQAASYPTLYNLSTKGGQALDRMSIYQWIESRVPGGHSSPLGMLIDIAYNIEYGAETTDQSALNLVYLLGYGAKPGNFLMFGKSDERFHIDGGNERLPQAIHDDVTARGVSVLPNHRMAGVVRNSNGTYTLAFDGRPSVVAEHVVLALPFAVLRTLDIRRAGFDSLKTQAIQQLGRGLNSKLVLQFNNRIWNGTGAWPGISNGSSTADTGYQNTWDVSRGQAGQAGLLVDYTGGKVAASFRPSVPYSDATDNATQVTAYARTFLKRLEPVFPGITGQWNGRATLSVPALDPNLLASYSYYRVGQYTAFGGYEKMRQGNVHFAGEHTSQDFQGYMEGGASEGVRVAQEILADLK
jgi:monoamine oxidase